MAVKQIRRDVARLLCIFPFEEPWFRERGVNAEYVGHPLSRLIKVRVARGEFFRKHGLKTDQPVVALLPGSRAGEARRHLRALADAVRILQSEQPASFILASPAGRPPKFWEPISGSTIQVIEGETWEAIAHADVALAASGTVTVEAALLGTPMVTYYRVTPLSWWLGRCLVDVPHYSMVNLIAGREIVPEIMQEDMTGERLAHEALPLLRDGAARSEMKRNLGEVAAKLSGESDPMARAARVVQEILNA